MSVFDVPCMRCELTSPRGKRQGEGETSLPRRFPTALRFRCDTQKTAAEQRPVFAGGRASGPPVPVGSGFAGGRPAPRSPATWRRVACALAALCASLLVADAVRAAPSYADVIAQVQRKVVKVYGAGGFRGLEAYQSGILISDEGLVLTVWSYVLDSDETTVTLDDGRRFKAKLLGADPRLELALLKIDGVNLDHFELAAAVPAEPGARVLAFSNLFGVATGDEMVSVQHGAIAAKTHLEARRGVFETTYKGPVYVIDAMTNNPGAAGGALTDHQGRLLGMLGKELRNTMNNTWMNYAIPIDEMTKTIDEIRSGKFVRKPTPDVNAKPEKSLSVALLGMVLVPDVLERTPPFIDGLVPGSPAAKAGLRPDDLVLFVNDRLVQSCKALHEELSFIDRVDKVKLTVIRGQDLTDVTLAAPAENP
jgi:S1-C subfamily serine protease